MLWVAWKCCMKMLDMLQKCRTPLCTYLCVLLDGRVLPALCQRGVSGKAPSPVVFLSVAMATRSQTGLEPGLLSLHQQNFSIEWFCRLFVGLFTSSPPVFYGRRARSWLRQLDWNKAKERLIPSSCDDTELEVHARIVDSSNMDSFVEIVGSVTRTLTTTLF